MMRGHAALIMILCAVGLSVPARLWAHHSIAAGFDMDATTSVTGTVTKMEWRNPHALLSIDVKNAQGQIEHWSIWFGSSNSMYRRGWHNDDLPVGATVSVEGFRARDKSFQIYGGTTKLADGRTLFGGENPNEAPGGGR